MEKDIFTAFFANILKRCIIRGEYDAYNVIITSEYCHLAALRFCYFMQFIQSGHRILLGAVHINTFRR